MRELRRQMYGKPVRLRTCQAWVYETKHFYILRSYNTFIACISKKTDVIYDNLRREYGYTPTSAQHVSKFRKDFSTSKWGAKQAILIDTFKPKGVPDGGFFGTPNNKRKGIKTMKEKIKRLEQAIELAKRNVTIYINGFMITNYICGMDKDIEINYDFLPSLDIIVNGIIEFSIPLERIKSIETIGEVLYKE